MSFGTGHHATTHLMIQSMEQIDFNNKHVLDFGTGTGVLAILAERLGANPILAIDNDEWSINNAEENIALNHCSNITIQQADVLQMSTEFDVILANINKHVIIDTLRSMEQQLLPGGTILLSGLLQNDAKDVDNIARDCGLVLKQQCSKNGWIALQYDKA